MATHNQTSHFRLFNLLFERQAPVFGAATHHGIFAGLGRHFNAWRERRAAVNELSGLSDRELADIGLTRQEIPDLVYKKR
jgi:uncharacterized protein YjiS (DUF1127 family)